MLCFRPCIFVYKPVPMRLGLLSAFFWIISLQLTTAQSLHIQFDSVEVHQGDTVGVQLLAFGFNNIISMQMPVRWDGDVVKYTGYSSHPALGSDFMFNSVTFSDTLLMQWMGPFGGGGSIMPITLPDSAVMITFFFEAVGDAGMESKLDTFLMTFAVEIMAHVNNTDIQIPLTTSPGRIRIITECAPNPAMHYDTLYACQGENLWFHGTNLTAPGTYNFVLEDQVFCDSLLSLTVIHWLPDITELHVYVCGGDTYSADTITLTNQNGCDSLVVTAFIPSEPDTTWQTYFVCSEAEVSTDTVWLTNAVGCDSLVISVWQHAPVTFQATSLPANCTLDNGVASLSAPDTSILSVTWADGTVGWVNSGLPEGFHAFSITSIYGCTATDSVEVGTQSGLILHVSDTILPCSNNGNWTVTAMPSGGVGNYTYQWSSGATTSSASVVPGQYSVTVTDSEGCTAELEFSTQVSGQLSIEGIVSDPVCHNGQDGSVELINMPPGSTYVWAGTGDSTASIIGLAAGIYSVSVIDPYGCSGEAGFVLSNPDSIEIAIEEISPICGNTPGVVSGSASMGTPSYSYSWSNGGEGPVIGVSQGGTLSVTVTDALGCNAQQSVILEAHDGVQLQIDYQHVTCYGAHNGSIDVNTTSGNAPFTFTWAHGPQSEDLDNLGPGSYEIQVEDSNGCLAAATITIAQPDSLSTQSTVLPHSSGQGWNIVTQTTGGVPPYQYSWLHGPATASLSNVSDGVYTLTVTDANGCWLEILVTAGTVSTAFPANENHGFTIYPNPASGHFTVSLLHREMTWETMSIRDLTGREVLAGSLKDLPDGFSTDVSMLPQGTYIVSIILTNGRQLNALLNITR